MEIANAFIATGHGYPFMDSKRFLKGSELDNTSMGDILTVDDLLDFSNEDIAGPIGENCPPTGSPATFAETLSSNTAADRRSSQVPNVFEPDGPGELCVPCDDLEELEWLSNFVEESFSSGDASPTIFNSCINNSYEEQLKLRGGKQKFQSASPVSVLKSDLCSGKFGGFSLEVPVPARARSKRRRPGVCFWNNRIISAETSATMIETSSTSTLTATAPLSPESDALLSEQGGAESSPFKKRCKEGYDAAQGRRCLHCATQRTPQWRAGPMGPKTLCNACGVRYKSGRLLPEYRPAASPTFMESVHSNSHKRVLEMRRQKVEEERRLEEEESVEV